MSHMHAVPIAMTACLAFLLLLAAALAAADYPVPIYSHTGTVNPPPIPFPPPIAHVIVGISSHSVVHSALRQRVLRGHSGSRAHPQVPGGGRLLQVHSEAVLELGQGKLRGSRALYLANVIVDMRPNRADKSL